MGCVSKSGWRRYSLVLILPLLLGTAGSQEIEHTQSGATAALVEILKYWHDENYEAIYDRGTTTTQRLFTRKDFVLKMRSLGCRPTCCHTTFELHAAEAQSPTFVVVTGKVDLQFAGPTVPRFTCAPSVRSYPMSREAEGWRVDLTSILVVY